MVSALQHQSERCSVELRIRKPSDTLVPGGMDSPPTPMYVPHSPWDPGKRCTGAEVIGTTLQEPLYSVDAHHSTCWFRRLVFANAWPSLEAAVLKGPKGALCLDYTLVTSGHDRRSTPHTPPDRIDV